jgi:hypothetical protein
LRDGEREDTTGKTWIKRGKKMVKRGENVVANVVLPGNSRLWNARVEDRSAFGLEQFGVGIEDKETSNN